MARAPAKHVPAKPAKAPAAPAKAPAPAPKPNAALKAQLRGATFAAGEAMLKPAGKAMPKPAGKAMPKPAAKPGVKGPAKDPAEAQLVEIEAILAQMPSPDLTPEPEAPEAPEAEEAPADDLLALVDVEGDAAAAADTVELEAPVDDLGPDPGPAQASAAPAGPLLTHGEVAGEAASGEAEASQEGGDVAAAVAPEEVAASAGAAPAASGQQAAEAAVAQGEAAAQAAAPAGGVEAARPVVPEEEAAAVADVQERLRPREGGSPLPEGVRERLEQRSGIDLADVRVHQGGEAGAALGAMGAKASTSGKDIVLREAGDLESPKTLATLGHEVGHLAQQAEGKADDVWAPGQQTNRAAMEHEADAGAMATDTEGELEAEAAFSAKPGAPGGTGGTGALGAMDPRARRGGPLGRGRGRGRGKDKKGKKGGPKRPLRKLPTRLSGQPQFLGMPSLPNPVDVAKRVKNAGEKAAKKTADKAVDTARWAGKKVRDGTSFVSRKIASAARKIISKGADLVMAAVKGAISKLMSVKTLIAGLKKLPGMKEAAEKVEQAVSLAERAKAEFDLAKKRAQQAAKAVRKLNALVRQVRRRGPAYYDAAKEAVGKVVRALSDPGALYATGKAAIKSALTKVAEQAREQWKAARKAVAAPFKSMGGALRAVGTGLKNAGEWMWSRREGFQKIFEGATELLSLLPPPVGPVAGLANALSHAARGDWKGAGAGLVSAIPGVGQAARAGMYGAKAAGHVQKIDRVIQRAQGASKAMQASAKTRLTAMVSNWQAGRKQLAQGASRAKAELARRLQPIRAKYHDYKPRLAQYQTAIQGRLDKVKERVGPLYERYRSLNEKITKAEELYTTIKSAGGSILDGMQDVVEPQPATEPAEAQPAPA